MEKINYNQYLAAYFHKASKCLAELYAELPEVTILSAQDLDSKKLFEYFEASQIFNTRLQQNPLAIVFCKNAQDVSTTLQIAIRNDIPIRVRAGGHDHEGESSGTNVVLIDVSNMKSIEVDPITKIAKIGAGNRFIRLTSQLAKEDVMIAHGTCPTVCITGFTLGGGWGPWTRKMGMNCEHLKGATLVLGDGSIIDIDESKDGVNHNLLWALRGGGGMSYGIVTELRVQTFVLPKELIKFELHWNQYDEKEEYPTENHPTLNILQAWENIILSQDTVKLIGTNLKINARPREETFDYKTVMHGCCMYGYWEGNDDELKAFVQKYFRNVYPQYIQIDGEGGTNPESKDPKQRYINAKGLMGNWDRESFAKVNIKLSGLLQGTPIPPDDDLPAPHKITSRLVNKEGLEAKGYEQLLSSLTSDLVLPENRGLGLFTYVTLGAITGDYYHKNANSDTSAFPYKDKLYTIQYQTWWNEADRNSQYPEPSQEDLVYRNINLAMDWIDVARNFDIPNTSGAFISFKDNSIPTETYFDKHYELLKHIKDTYSRDPYNHFRTRKTIR